MWYKALGMTETEPGGVRGTQSKPSICLPHSQLYVASPIYAQTLHSALKSGANLDTDYLKVLNLNDPIKYTET